MEWQVLMAFILGAFCCGGIFFIIFQQKQKKRLRLLQEMVDSAAKGQLKITSYEETKMSSLENDLYNYLTSTLVTAESLADQKRVIQRLISDISHQCVTPIANVMLYTQLLEEKNLEDSAEIQLISQQTKKLDFLIKSLVKMSRLETGTIVPVPKKQPLAPLLLSMQEQFRLNLLSKELKLTIVVSEEMAVYDRKWTLEALANIVDNAIKYSPKGGTIRIAVDSSYMFNKIIVQDQGRGIPENEQSKIFQRFYRCEDSADQPGIGVGLSLTRQIIEAQGGYIKVASSVGKGSSFSLCLPAE